MTIIRNINEDIDAVGTINQTYLDYRRRWTYLLESYLGGEEYRQGKHLTRYALETDAEYAARLKETPLDNHCRSVISVYNSFLFREEPERELGSLEGMPEVEAFLEDADMDGRSLNAFMKDVSTWANVFGHCWILVSKPNIGAVTRYDEIAQEVRPYVSLMTPLVVLDWSWYRKPNGKYVLDYLKYIEQTTGSLRTYKEWNWETIRTWTVDVDQGLVVEEVIEPNQLNKIPAVIAYANRSTFRGIGVSNITDIADAQKFIYNATSEVAQSIRLDSHPSLVKTPETQAGIGAGSIIHMPENMDPGLRPYLLEFNGASVASIYQSIKATIDSIDKMANTGAVRATESRTMSGVAMNTEFQLLNAKLSEMADNLELAEEQMWYLFCMYQGVEWDGEIDYPGAFNIRNTADEIQQLAVAAGTNPADPRLKQAIDVKILDWLDLDEDELAAMANPGLVDLESVPEDTGEPFVPHVMTNPVTGEQRTVQSQAEHEALMNEGWIHQED